MATFAQGSFIIPEGTTPDMLRAKRERLAALMPRYGQAKYVGEGIGQLFSGIAQGRQNRAMDAYEGDQRKAAADMFNNRGPLSVLGMQPAGPNQDIADEAMTAIGQGGGLDAATIRAGLIERGLPEHIADGFVMNFQDESGLNPGINERAPIVPGSRGGFGLAQWTGPRRRALEAFAQQRGLPVSDANLQMDFLMTELQGPESKAWQAISAAPDAGQAGAAIVNNFLRPAEQHRASREARYTGGQPTMSAQGRAPSGGADVSYLMQLASNPWLTQEQRAVINAELQQAQRQADPSYQMGLEMQRLQLDALRNPQAEFRDMTPEEVAARGLPPGAYQVASNGEIKPVTKGGVNVTNNIGGDDKFGEEFAKLDAKALATLSESGTAAQRNMGRIDQLEKLLQTSPTGLAGAAKLRAGEWGINTEGLDDLQAAQALINSLVPEQRQPGSGPMSDADLELFKQSLPRIINQQGGNQLIINTMRAIAQYDAEGAQIVQRLRAEEIDRATAFDLMINRADPMQAYRSAVGSAPAAPAAGGGNTNDPLGLR